MKKIALLILIAMFLLSLSVHAQINLLHEFVGDTSDGWDPYGSMIISGSTLYGMTSSGGGSGYGTIFKIETNGTGFALLHEFAGGAADGGNPDGSLIISGTTLYGMTKQGGYGSGTIFKIETNGSGFTLLHKFGSAATDGGYPHGSLILSGSTLYGMTRYGGDSDFGTIFKIGIDGSGYSLLHEFAGGTDDGYDPWGSLIILDSTLYGMTNYGGNSNSGTIFKIQTDGTAFTLLHSFADSVADGRGPYGSLILSGSILYGMTRWGGSNNLGTIFKIESDGTDFNLLHSFSAGIADGRGPFMQNLILSNSILYGMTTAGGNSNVGTIFKMQTDGSGFSLLHSFAGGADDGKDPRGSPILSGATLYGMTSNGGDNDKGVVFSLPVAETISKDDLLATWDGQGVYYRNSDTGAWVKLATPATLIAAGDLDGDCIDDVIGIWPVQGGVWVKYSASGSWAKLSTTARHIAAGDMNGDGRPELLGTWDGQGVYWRDNTTGAWTQLATPATLITSGDLDGDGSADLIGIWPSQGGVWVKYSQSGAWAKLSTTAVDIAAGDMNGDGRDDLVATWDGQGVYYRNSIGGAWVKMATPATQVTAGDLDGDGTDDVIGIWPSQAGVWVKYSQTGAWAKLSSTAVDIAAGRMRAAGSASLSEPDAAAAIESENSWGPDALACALDLSENGPGGMGFICRDGENLEPRESGNALRVPGPGELGFKCLEQKNLVPGSVIAIRQKVEKNNR